MQKVRPCMWYDDDAEEAVTFYTTLFDDAEVTDVMRAGPDGPAIALTFRIKDAELMALNGGKAHHFTEANSLYVSCGSQAEVDRYWDALVADGGEASMCGWLKDRWGLSWQIIPDRLIELMSDPDPARGQRATQAMLQMQKIDVAALEAAADGG